MAIVRHFDTVVFDVRHNANMLFFARTSDTGSIEEYLLLMRSLDPGFEEIVYVEFNEEQLATDAPIREATLSNNLLTLSFEKPVKALDEQDVFTASFDDNPENRGAIEAGLFSVLGRQMSGGHA